MARKTAKGRAGAGWVMTAPSGNAKEGNRRRVRRRQPRENARERKPAAAPLRLAKGCCLCSGSRCKLEQANKPESR